MKKHLFTFAMLACTTLFAQTPVINGGDFEDWATFTGNLNTYGIKQYATQGTGEGKDGSNSLSINTTSTTTTRNDWVFTAKGVSNLPANATKITFWVKGTSSDKSLSINVYNTNNEYYKFNVGDLTKNKTIEADPVKNDYLGSINTNGKWVQVTLDLKNPTPITDYAESKNGFLGVKIGKKSDFDIDLDNFEIVTANAASVEKVEIDGFKLYPNPAKNTVNILTKLNDVKEVSLYSVLGKEVLKTSLKGSKLNIENIAAGVYFIKVVENNKTAYKKLVIK